MRYFQFTCKGLLPAGLLLCGLSSHAATILTKPNTFQAAFGVAYLGETFTVPTDNVLSSFTFTSLKAPTAPGTLDFSIYAYNNTTNMVSGPALFTGPSFSFPTTAAAYTYTPNLTLTSGNVYIALAHSNGGFVAGASSANPGGEAGNNAGVGSAFVKSGFDIAFSATFNPPAPANVPEPGSVALLTGMGVVGAGFLRRRKQSVRKSA